VTDYYANHREDHDGDLVEVVILGVTWDGDGPVIVYGDHDGTVRSCGWLNHFQIQLRQAVAA
jgi:hypothetical protein